MIAVWIGTGALSGDVIMGGWKQTCRRIMIRIGCIACLATGLALAAEPGAGSKDAAKKLAERIGTRRGICVLVEPAEDALALALAGETELIVYVQFADAARVDRLRKAADRAGVLGARLYVERGRLNRIHLADNLADAVVVSAAVNSKLDQPARAELLRVARPGAALLLGTQATTKPIPKGIDEWSHPYHRGDNNPRSTDEVARGPYLTQFLAAPFYGPMPEVTLVSGGRIFKAFGHIAFKQREWPLVNKLIVLNSYNGTVLWTRDLSEGFMIHRNTFIATPEVLYLADDKSCKLLDASSGEVIDEIIPPAEVTEERVWKWMAIEDGVLYALLGEQEQPAIPARGTRTAAGWPWSSLLGGYSRQDYPWGFGRTLLAIDLKSKEILWSRAETELIDSRATCMSSGRLFYYCHPKLLAALDTKTGKPLWKTDDAEILQAIGEHDRAQNPRRGYSSQTYAKCNDKAIYFAGPQRRAMLAVSASDGRLLWKQPHGNYQLVLRDDALYAMGRETPSLKLDLTSGKTLAELECFRGNCTRATGTIDSIFTRGYRHSGTQRIVLDGDRSTRIPLMRPACQDGVIAAGGLLYWGPWMCDCNLQLVGIISLGPAGDFKFDQQASDAERLEMAVEDPQQVAKFDLAANDWPTYRAGNTRPAQTSVSVGSQLEQKWQYQCHSKADLTAPVTAGGLVFVAGADGAVRAIDTSSGAERWTAYTGGQIFYPPAIWQGRVYVGSADGCVVAFEAASGRQLWRFRAAPAERKIPVYGRLSSTWPVASGVLVQDGVAYAAAGIASYDGTHVFALDAITGQLRWQNNSSGRLVHEELISGVSVQGHLLLHEDKLYLAGGNVVSPAVYDIKTGKCLSQLDDEWKRPDGEWQKAPRGRELFLVDGKVMAFDQLLYSPAEYQQGRYFNQDFAQSGEGDVVVRSRPGKVVRLAKSTAAGAKPAAAWESGHFARVDALVVGKSAVLAAGPVKEQSAGEKVAFALAALDLGDGSLRWSRPLPAPPKSWGLAVDRGGHVLVTLKDSRVLLFGPE